MQILGRSIETREILIGTAGVLGSFGLCYAGYSFFKAVKNEVSESRIPLGKEDLELPLVLESEYGDFKETCLTADPIASAYLTQLPDLWFNFNQNFLLLANNTFRKRASPPKRVLVIGSSTGQLTFELGKTFGEVIGIDISFTKVITCFKFQNRTPVTYYFPLEGSYRTSQKTINLEEPIVRPSRRRRGVPVDNIEFINANPCHDLPKQLGQFQAVLLRNSLNDLDDPEGLLRRVHRFVESEGALFIISDYNWKRVTNQHEGFGEVEVTNSFEFLKAVLVEHFEFNEERDIMEILPESLRSCRIHNRHVTVWLRKPDEILP